MDAATVHAHFLASADAMLVADHDGDIVLANPAAHRLFGYAHGALVGLGVDQLVPSALRGTHASHRANYGHEPRARLMGEQSGPLMAVRHDGSIFPAEISLSPAAAAGPPTVMAVIRDISERLAFDVESAMVRKSLDSVDEAVFMFHAESLEFCYVNSGATQTGYSREELLGGMTPLHIKPEYDRTTFHDLISPLLSGERSVVTFETVHRRKDGNHVPVEVMLQHPGPLVGGQVCLIELVRDISSRIAQHERLVGSEQAFRSAFEDAPVGMAIAEVGTHERPMITSANAALSEMLGYQSLDLIGRTFESLAYPGDARSELELPTALPVPGPVNMSRTQQQYRHADGHGVWALVSSVQLAGPEGLRSLTHIVDITRRVELEAERDLRELFLSFLGDIRLAVLSNQSLDDVFTLILSTAKAALGAIHVLIAMPDRGGALRIAAAETSLAVGEIGDQLPPGSHEAIAFEKAESLVLTDLANGQGSDSAAEPAVAALGPMVVSPLVTKENPLGVLVVGRPTGAGIFDAHDVRFVEALSSESALALEFQRARDERTRLRLAEDRERIARELQDRVIQRLFAVGMSLQANLDSPENLETKAADAVHELDSCIAVVRDSIFKLGAGPENLPAVEP